MGEERACTGLLKTWIATQRKGQDTEVYSRTCTPCRSPGCFIFLARNIGNRALYYSKKLSSSGWFKVFYHRRTERALLRLPVAYSLNSVPSRFFLGGRFRLTLLASCERGLSPRAFDAKKLTMRNCLAKSSHVAALLCERAPV